MGKTCSDPKCHTGRSGGDEKSPQVTLHKLRPEWRAVIPDGEKISTADPRLCSLPFKPECFKLEQLQKRTERASELVNRILIPGGMPTIWPSHHWFSAPFLVSILVNPFGPELRHLSPSVSPPPLNSAWGRHISSILCCLILQIFE